MRTTATLTTDARARHDYGRDDRSPSPVERRFAPQGGRNYPRRSSPPRGPAGPPRGPPWWSPPRRPAGPPPGPCRYSPPRGPAGPPQGPPRWSPRRGPAGPPQGPPRWSPSRRPSGPPRGPSRRSPSRRPADDHRCAYGGLPSCDGPTSVHPPSSTWAPAWRLPSYPPCVPPTLWSGASPANPQRGHAYEWALTPVQQPSTSSMLILLPALPRPLPQHTPTEEVRQPLYLIGGSQVPPPQQTTQAAAPQPLYVLGGSQTLPQQQTPTEAAPQELYVVGGSQAPPPSPYMLVPARHQPHH